MKKFFLSFAIMLVMLFSCNPSDDQINAEDTKVVPLARFTGTSFDNYYQLHNPSLDAFYNDVQKNESLYFANTSEGRDRGYSILTNYLISESSRDISSTWLSNFFSAQKNVDRSSHPDYIRITNSSYFTRLKDIMDVNTDVARAKSEIESLITILNADNSVADFDKIALKAAMQIGGESFEYWTINDDKWRDLAVRNGARRSPRKQAMMQADVEGAVSGAIGGAILGAPFVGAGAGAGALLGAMYGAAWGSAVSGAFSHFGIWD